MLAQRLKQRLKVPARSESGFTLIELMVALLLLAIIMSASLYAILQGLSMSRDSNNRVVASTIVSGVLEKLRTESLTAPGFAQIPVTSEGLSAQTVQGTQYQLNQDVEWVPRGTTNTSCNSANNASFVLRATVTATWNAPDESVVDSTLMAPPSGTLNSADGALGVQVTLSSGQAFSGATVTIQDQRTHATLPSIITGSDGCAFFAQVPADTYLVTVSAANTVGQAEVSPYTTTQSVSATLIQQLVTTIDYGGSIDWAYSPTSLTPAQGMPISIDHPGQFTYNLYPFTNITGTSGVLSPVYPTTYQTIFAGGCTDADPDGANTNGQAFYPSASPSAVVVAPNLPTSAAVQLYPLNLAITSKTTGSPITTAYTGTNPAPSATAGNGSCPNGSPTYTLSAFPQSPATGQSVTGVGLGQLAISVTVTVPGTPSKTERGTVSVWVKPDGVYNAAGTTELYSFASGGTVSVPVS